MQFVQKGQTTKTCSFSLTSLFSRNTLGQAGSPKYLPKKDLWGLLVEDLYRSDPLPVTEQTVVKALKSLSFNNDDRSISKISEAETSEK